MKVEEPFDPETISIEQLKERIGDIREEAYQLRKLGENPAWIVFANAVSANSEALRKGKTGRVLGSVDDSLAHNYHCGIADGLDRAISLREEIVQEIELVLEEHNALLKEKEDAQTATDVLESGRADGDTADLFPGSSANGDASGTSSDEFAP